MIRGYRWIETGRKVWQLESQPRRFHGCVSLRFAYVKGRVKIDEAAPYSWWIAGGGPQGESATKREAMDAVENYIRALHRGELPSRLGFRNTQKIGCQHDANQTTIRPHPRTATNRPNHAERAAREGGSHRRT